MYTYCLLFVDFLEHNPTKTETRNGNTGLLQAHLHRAKDVVKKAFV